jgi:Raf kinase inhibitor-like YbhB/YbcL family protein
MEAVMPKGHASPHAGGLLAIERVEPFEHRGIAVVSDALDAEGRIGDPYSAYHDDIAPELKWSEVLEAESYALVVQDPDAPGEEPFLHWMVWNIPGTANGIPARLGRGERPAELPGAVQGLNSAGWHGWHGVKPPTGDGAHHYHCQVFALAGRLDHLSSHVSVDALVNALKGMTIAAGELVGTYERRDPIANAPSPGRTGSYGSCAHSPTREELASGRGGLDEDDVDRHAPHDPDGGLLHRGQEKEDG